MGAAPFGGLRRLDLRDAEGPDVAIFRAMCERAVGRGGAHDAAAAEILAAVRDGGDAAVAAFTQRFEGREITAGEFAVDASRWAAAAERVPQDVAQAVRVAAERIRLFHETQVAQSSGRTDSDGRLESRAFPLQRVAVYAPGGTAAYPSSVLMAAIPAKVAGVEDVVLVTPRADDTVLLAAREAGVSTVLEIGGAQAIAAVAYGTESIARVDKIVGPGNAYVTAAKRLVYGLCDIDGIAGPSEIMILADGDADPGLIAADLLSQAEHDTLACAVCVTTAPELADRIDEELRRQLSDLPRRDMAREALAEQGALVTVSDREALVRAAQDYAPEHLELLVADPEALVDRLSHAGAIFVGASTPEAAGDYTAGPSHVLPTAGAARFASPLGVWDFVKYVSVLQLSAEGLARQAPTIVALARAEGLEAHARAVELRTKDAGRER